MKTVLALLLLSASAFADDVGQITLSDGNTQISVTISAINEAVRNQINVSHFLRVGRVEYTADKKVVLHVPGVLYRDRFHVIDQDSSSAGLNDLCQKSFNGSLSSFEPYMTDSATLKLTAKTPTPADQRESTGAKSYRNFGIWSLTCNLPTP